METITGATMTKTNANLGVAFAPLGSNNPLRGFTRRDLGDMLIVAGFTVVPGLVVMALIAFAMIGRG